MFEAPKKKAVELLDRFGRLLSTTTPTLHPLDDPEAWRKVSADKPPSDVDIVAAQKWIDSMMGTTRNNGSIYKLVWNGDRDYWYQFFMKWNAFGQPDGPVVKRPRVRYKVVRDANGRPVRDVFPPRWLILTRLEPEQYADSWKRESYVFAPEIGCDKQIRPDEPPPVFWMWYMTIAAHSDYCCATAQKNKEMCYGKYADPYFAKDILENQRAADLAAGNMSPFEKVDGSWITEIEDQNHGYTLEMAELQAEAEISIENPMALLGVTGSMKAGIDDPKQARQIVKEFYDRQIQEQSKLL